jgi:uncharacterized protein
MPQTAHGRFVWHDLTTPDPAAAISFYTQITSWTTQPWENAKDYTMWALDGVPLGGVSQEEPGTPPGTPPHWLPYVDVYDVDACIRQVSSLGGSVRTPPTQVPHVGTWAIIADPFGASIGIFESTDKPPGHDGVPNIGEFSWHELTTTDYKAAAEFYRALFRWEKMSEFDMGEMGVYYIFGQKGQQYGGMFNRTAEMPPPNWLSYIRVPQVKPVADKAKELGGTVFNGPMEVPGGDWIAQCMDPQGAAFALHAR